MYSEPKTKVLSTAIHNVCEDIIPMSQEIEPVYGPPVIEEPVEDLVK